MVHAAVVSSSMREFLVWLDAAPRTYDETMDAWRTSCPRLSLWEDATIGGLVELVRDDAGCAVVCLTEIGRVALARP
jgi:hypothetical protein